ncbi:transcriptional regulator with XRE-family HTH domain [Xanthomonas arboricola]|uniref:helix-turn-helix domain-containing protein n=1 Tax=Xanthomonas euroxanthea TaxID=2259622 RepID=UPI00142F86AF|nr:helix-turn-helix transcriptional regulator [Xanthomonas euroxanthea]NJC38163.1 transcriptional regulator with XRE-family HTH domain [Xanthomonas euroxanthea]
MPRPANPKTPEGHLITEAIQRSGQSQAKLADALDVSAGFISQFATGHRPVPWDKAEPLASRIGVAPEQISSEYRRLQAYFAESHSQRLDAEIILAAVAYAKKIAGLMSDDSFSIEHRPQELADAINATLEMKRLMEENSESEGRNGKISRVSGDARPKATRPEIETARGRTRKSA